MWEPRALPAAFAFTGAPMTLVGVAVVALVASPLLALFVARPTRTIIPLYALVVPAGSAIELALPVPSPFDTLSSLFGALALAAVLAHIALYRDGAPPRLPVALWLAFLASAVTTAFWAIDPSGSVKTLAAALPLVALLFGVSLLRFERSDFELLRVAVIASGIVIGLYAVFLLASGSQLPTHGTGEGVRLSVIGDSEDANPNILAASLLLPLALSVEALITAGWTRRPRQRRLLGLAGTVLCLFGLLLTGSRGGVISGLLVLVLTFFLCVLRPELRAAALRAVFKTVVVVVSALVLLGVTEYLAPGSIQRVTSFSPIQRLTRPESSGRTAIWSTGYLACKQYCGWGAGIGNFNNAYSLFFPYSGAIGNIGINRPAHNIYLQLIVETGAVGIILLFLALLSEWMSMAHSHVARLAPSLRAALLGILLAEFFLTAIWFKFFWLLFIIVRAAERAGPLIDEPARRGPPLPSKTGRSAEPERLEAAQGRF